MVVDGFNTRSSSLRAALDAMRNTHVNILGVIMNKLKPARFGYGYIYPYHYYSNYNYYADPEQVHVNGKRNGKVALARDERGEQPSGQSPTKQRRDVLDGGETLAARASFCGRRSVLRVAQFQRILYHEPT